jgi:ribonucleotide monophosphatase NagD (HAD superfamily)
MRYAARRLRLAVPGVGVVGDDPLVEVLMARRARATAIGVTTGVTSATAWRAQPPQRRPHHVLRALGDVLKLL